MPTKDRLNELQQVVIVKQTAKMAKQKKGESKDMRKIFEKSDIITKWIEAIEENTNVVDGILNDSVFRVTPELQQKIKVTFKNTETIAFNVASKLKEISKDLEKTAQANDAQHRMKYLQYTSLNARFRDVLQKHRLRMEKHRDIGKEILGKCNKIVNDGGLDDYELEMMMECDEQTQIFVKDYLSQERDARRQLADIEERHKELIIIETHLEEVKGLFINLAMLVEEQQESINRVAHHAETATDYIDKTVVDLKSANTKKSSKRKCSIILGVAIFLGLIILISILV